MNEFESGHKKRSRLNDKRDLAFCFQVVEDLVFVTIGVVLTRLIMITFLMVMIVVLSIMIRPFVVI